MIIEEIITQNIQNMEIIGRTCNSSKAKYTKHFLITDNDIEFAFLSLDVIPYVDYLVLYETYIIKEQRNKGYGTKLLHKVETLGSDLAYKYILSFLKKVFQKKDLLIFIIELVLLNEKSVLVSI